MFYKAKKVESFTLAMLATYRNASKNTTKANQLIPKAEALFHMIYYEACLNEEDAKEILSLAEQFMEIVFVAPAKVKEIKEKRNKNATK